MAIQIITAILISLLFVYISMIKIKAGLALSFVIAATPLAWIIFRQINEKKFILGFFVVYPLLPFLAGMNMGPGIPVLRSHRIAIMILILFLMSKGSFLKYYGNFFKANIFNFNIILLISSFFLTAFFSYNTQGTIFYALSYFFEFLILSAVVFSVFQTRSDIELLFKSLIISGSLLCLFGFIERSLTYNFYSAFGVFHDNLSYALSHQIRDNEIRAQGPFEHSIAYAAYLTAILPLFLYKFRDRVYLFNISVLLIAGAIFVSQSRSGLLGITLIFFLYFIFINKKNLVFSFIIAIPVLLYKAEDIMKFIVNLNPFTSTSSEMADSTAARGTQFAVMAEVIKQNMVFGYGLVPAGLASVDNFYLSFTYQFGLVGLISYLLFLLMIFIKPAIIFGRTILKDDMLMLLLMGLFAIFTINIFVTLLSYHYIIFVYIGIITRLCYNKRMELHAEHRNSEL